MTLSPQESRARSLHAGPIRVKFVDGELRYLTVGDTEIIRRVYFAVRDGQWNTTPPEFTQIDVEQQGEEFRITLAAVCRDKNIDYAWHGTIVGTANGRITFQAGGHANRDFPSQRIGLCVLYGAGPLAGHAFETTDDVGKTGHGEFPTLVSPTLVAPHFQTLTYATDGGMQVQTTLVGATFDMEDQRNWGDSSYKAYAPLAYPYPNIAQGADAAETLTIQVSHAPQITAAETPTHIMVGQILPHVKVPQIALTAPETPDSVFQSVNSSRKKRAGAKTLTWGLRPSVHLPDDDNFMDNVSTVVDQVRTAHSFAPDAVIRIAPIHLTSTPMGQPRDPRESSAFGAAWSAAAIEYLSLAGVTTAEFGMGPGQAQILQQKLAAYAGHPLYATTVRGSGNALLDALAIDDHGAPLVWLINLTGRPQAVICEGRPGDSEPRSLTLSPFEVREIKNAE